MDKKFKYPPVVWMKVTDYMHGWLQHELGCNTSVMGQSMVSVLHLPGARNIMRAESVDDVMERRPIENVMSTTRYGCYAEGLSIDADVMTKEYGITRDTLQLYIPVECPRMCMTKNGTLRPWMRETCLTKEQASALMRVIKDAFWKAVTDFDREYSRRHGGSKYPAVEMIEAFCQETHTPDLYVEAIRREWQRRVKRQKS